jgi:hypothetical protein
MANSPEKNNYIDPKGYWIDPAERYAGMGNEAGEQVAILRATSNCSDAEWDRLYEAIVACFDTEKV